MKKINLGGFSRKEVCSRLSNFKFSAYTLAEVIIVMLIIAVVVAVSIGITKAKLDNIVSYTYYNAYSSLRKISAEMLADWDPQDTEYRQVLSEANIAQENASNPLMQKFKNINELLLSEFGKYFSQPAFAYQQPVCYDYSATYNMAAYMGCYIPSSEAPIQSFMTDCAWNYPGTQKKQSMQHSSTYACVYTNSVKCCNQTIYTVQTDGKLVCARYGGFDDGNCNSGGNSCTKTCSSGYTLDKTTCTCKCTRSCGSGYSLDSSSCTCKKNPCTNKPSSIPCGQSWDESTCSLKGTAKTCSDGYSLDSSCNCKCTRTCGSGYSLDTGSCTCKKNACTNKPSSIPCGQSWDESTCSLKGTPKTCSDGYSLNGSCNCVCTRTCGSGYTLDSGSCSCVKNKVSCWDGTEADSEAECPSFVTCWNGSKAHNYDECPPCENKPSTIPCGQSWDEHTCKLTGTAKTCPSGQHLNSRCDCVNDCPSAAVLTPCRLCSYETGEISTNPAINRTCSDETYEWSEIQCKCIISPRTLPRQGKNFCKLFERHSNIMGNTDVCSGSVISDGTTNFADKKPDISLRNGLRIYNMHTDAKALAVLSGNTQGGLYDGVPNTNAWGYTVYVDIDGPKGDSQLWSDVYPFYITLSGKIIPGYDSANPGLSGGDSTRHLQVSVEYENYASGNRRIQWLAKSVPFKEGACLSGYIGSATPYCRNNTPINKLSQCTTDGNSLCRLKQIQPVKFFF